MRLLGHLNCLQKGLIGLLIIILLIGFFLVSVEIENNQITQKNIILLQIVVFILTLIINRISDSIQELKWLTDGLIGLLIFYCSLAFSLSSYLTKISFFVYIGLLYLILPEIGIKISKLNKRINLVTWIMVSFFAAIFFCYILGLGLYIPIITVLIYFIEYWSLQAMPKININWIFWVMGISLSNIYYNFLEIYPVGNYLFLTLLVFLVFSLIMFIFGYESKIYQNEI